MRKPFVAGNWKMYLNAAGAQQLAAAVVHGLGSENRVTVGLFPPFPYLRLVSEVVQGSFIVLGAQNVYPEREGAFTGEVSPEMLLDSGCQYVIIGHSERRHRLGEVNAFVNRKVKAALSAGLRVILCIGETIEERQSNLAESVLESQIASGLLGVASEHLQHIVLAYEPVWAIGTGRNATPEQAQQAHSFIRSRITQSFGAGAGERILVQYGGSVKPENAQSLLWQPDVDGALVGGASLKADQFLAIVRAALPD